MHSQTRAPKVCHLGKYYPPAPGGIETHVQTLARAQAALGAEVRVVCVNHVNRAGRDISWCRHGASETHDEHDGAVRVTRLGRSASFARLDVCTDLPHILQELERDGTEVLHLHTPNPTMTLALAMLRPRIPVVITHHSDIIRQRIIRFALMPFERFVYSRAARIHSTSDAYTAGSSMLQRYVERVESLPLGVDLKAYLKPNVASLAIATQLQAEHGSPLWLAVGRCVYYKNFRVAIEALAHVPGRLLIIGQGPEQEPLQRQARELGVADRVIWWKYASEDELVGAYRAATALWFPSNAKSEAFGIVQVEAMASGCPVINANIPGSGVPWVSLHEETGLTVALNDPHALAKASWRLLSERGLRERLAAGGRQRACDEFDHIVMATRSLNTYRSVLASTTATTAADARRETERVAAIAKAQRAQELVEIEDAEETGLAV